MKSNILKTIILLFLVGTVVTGIRYAYQQWYGYGSGYVTIVMTTGDIYFGTITDTTRHDLVLEHSYYPQTFPTEQGSEIRIAKVGSELHQPKDKIYLNRDLVVMVQKLQEDSPIIATIEQNEAAQN